MGEKLEVITSVLSDRGRKRGNNEDFVTFFEPTKPEEVLQSGYLYIVADGVGGALEGERASRFAAEKVKYLYYYEGTELPPAERLQWAMRQVNREIYSYIEEQGSHKRMATTMVAAVILGEELIVAHVGDSRAYLIRNGLAQQLTQDHTIAGEMVRSGLIRDEEEARLSGGKNRLTRSLGGEEEVKVEVVKGIPLQVGDRLLLCTDGLTRYASNKDIYQLASEGNPEEATRRMIAFANERGGEDNITVALIEVTGKAALPAYAAGVGRGQAPARIALDWLETDHPHRPSKPGRMRRPAPAALFGIPLPSPRHYAALGVVVMALCLVVALAGMKVVTTVFNPSPTPSDVLHNQQTLVSLRITLTGISRERGTESPGGSTPEGRVTILPPAGPPTSTLAETSNLLFGASPGTLIGETPELWQTPSPPEAEWACFGRINENTYYSNIVKNYQELLNYPLDVYRCTPDEKPTFKRLEKRCTFSRTLAIGWESNLPAGTWVIIPDITSAEICWNYTYENSSGDTTFYGVWGRIVPQSPFQPPTSSGVGGGGGVDRTTTQPGKPTKPSEPSQPPPKPTKEGFPNGFSLYTLFPKRPPLPRD